jgi:hypothetical protein
MRRLLSILFALGGGATIMLQVGPHDAATNVCNWLSFWSACKQTLPESFDRWAWMFPAALLAVALGIIVWTPSVHIFQMWKKRYRLKEEKPESKLACSFDPSCVRPDSKITYFPVPNEPYPEGVSITTNMSMAPFGTSEDVTYYCLKVETKSVPSVAKCQGRLLWIDRGNERVLGQPIILPFSPSENNDALNKEIRSGVPEYLDFMAITDYNRVRLTPPKHRHPSSVDYDKIFSAPGDYTLRIAITSETPPIQCDVEFKWTGDRATSEITCREVSI